MLILGSQHYEDMTRLHSNGTGNTIWVNGGWKEKLQEQQQPNNFMTAGSNPDQGLYAEVGDANSNKSHLMSTFAAPSGGNYRLGPDPAPYATTTLAMQNRIRTMVSKKWQSNYKNHEDISGGQKPNKDNFVIILKS